VPSAPTAPQNLRKITKEYVQLDDATWRELSSFYGFEASLAKRFAVRVEGDKKDKVFMLSDGVESFLHSHTKMPTRMVLCGVAAFQKATSYHERASRWCPLQQGLPALVASGMRRRLSASRPFIARLLREKELSVAELREAEGQCDLHGLGELVDTEGEFQGTLRPGSLAVVLRAGAQPMCAPFAVLATLTDSMLELMVGNAAEVSPLLEDLEGQPPIEELLRDRDAEDAGADGDVEAAGEAEEHDDIPSDAQ